MTLFLVYNVVVVEVVLFLSVRNLRFSYKKACWADSSFTSLLHVPIQRNLFNEIFRVCLHPTLVVLFLMSSHLKNTIILYFFECTIN